MCVPVRIELFHFSFFIGLCHNNLGAKLLVTKPTVPFTMTILIGFSIFSLLYAWQVDAASTNCTTGSWIVGGSISLDSTTCDLSTVTAALAGGSACLSTIYPTNTAKEVATLCSGVEV
jgi:hypothetical protein